LETCPEKIRQQSCHSHKDVTDKIVAAEYTYTPSPTMYAAIFQRNSTIVPPNFPDKLPASTPPTALQLYRSIPPATLWGVYRIVTEGVRHEKNTYGYFDAVFNSIFPVSQRFQVRGSEIMRQHLQA